MLVIVRGLLLVAVMTATAGCLPAEASRAPIPTRRPLPPGVVALPDVPPCEVIGQPGIPCVYAGRLVAGVLHQRGPCVWIAMGPGSLEAQVLWPFGYSARFDPFVVFDNGGKVVARDGDPIYTGGWGPSPGDPDACGRAQYVSLTDEFEVGSEIEG